MNLSKIGKFISICRKNKNLTQEQLAEKLFITDRAVSKWERGLSLPDTSIMLELCNILDINVQELLVGEKNNMKDDKKKTEELLLKLAKDDEIKNKKIYTNMWVFGIIITIFYITLILVSCLTLEKGVALGIIIGLSTFIFAVTCFYLVKVELDAGYYECKKCHHKFIPSYLNVNIAPHMINTRYLKCPKCGKKSWCKKTMNK